MANILELTVTTEGAGLRLDVWLSRQLPALSRARLQKSIRSGDILVEGRPVKGHRKTRAGDRVVLRMPPPLRPRLEPEPIPLHVLYEDADVIVVNKPPGQVVHPAAGHASGTLVNALLHHCRDLGGIGGELRPGIVHRLDKDTSGAIVAAKNDAAMAGLVGQFKRREVRKEYLALVWGRPTPPAGEIETLIARSVHDRKRMAVTRTAGRCALTRYRTEAAFERVALLRIFLLTGRTHQIRVHMAHIGHPVVGDTRYGRRPARLPPCPVPRQMLHAEYLAFRHPATGAEIACTAPLFPDMAEVLNALAPHAPKNTPAGKTGLSMWTVCG